MEQKAPPKRLRDLLIEEGLVTEKQVEDALAACKAHGGRLAETMIERGYITDTKLEAALSGQPGIASVDLTRYQIAQRLCDLIPEDIALEHHVFPIDKMGTLLTIGMAVPIDTETIEEIKTITGLRVKAVYCKPEHILGAIERYYRPDEFKFNIINSREKKSTQDRAQGPAAMIRIANLLKNIDDLPSLPETVERTKEAIENPNVDIGEVIEVVERDPLVSAQVLKLTNSAAFSLPTQIDNVDAAIKLLGLRETYNVVLSSAVLSFVESAGSFDFQAFWQEALCAATAVPEIAAAIGMRISSALSTAGLLHDIGRFGLSQVAPEEYANIDAGLKGKALVKKEEEFFGLGHPEAAYILASRWELPEEIYTPIRFHHNPERAVSLKKETCIVSVAAFLAESHAIEQDVASVTDFEEIAVAMQELELSAEQLREIQEAAAAKVAE